MKSSYFAAIYLKILSPTHIKSGRLFGSGHCKVVTLQLMDKNFWRNTAALGRTKENSGGGKGGEGFGADSTSGKGWKVQL